MEELDPDSFTYEEIDDGFNLPVPQKDKRMGISESDFLKAVKNGVFSKNGDGTYSVPVEKQEQLRQTL